MRYPTADNYARYWIAYVTENDAHKRPNRETQNLEDLWKLDFPQLEVFETKWSSLDGNLQFCNILQIYIMISNILLDFFYSFDEIYRAISPWELTQYFGVFTHQLAEFICRPLKKKIFIQCSQFYRVVSQLCIIRLRNLYPSGKIKNLPIFL